MVKAAQLVMLICGLGMIGLAMAHPMSNLVPALGGVLAGSALAGMAAARNHHR